MYRLRPGSRRVLTRRLPSKCYRIMTSHIRLQISFYFLYFYIYYYLLFLFSASFNLWQSVLITLIRAKRLSSPSTSVHGATSVLVC